MIWKRATIDPETCRKCRNRAMLYRRQIEVYGRRMLIMPSYCLVCAVDLEERRRKAAFHVADSRSGTMCHENASGASANAESSNPDVLEPSHTRQTYVHGEPSQSWDESATTASPFADIQAIRRSIQAPAVHRLPARGRVRR